MSLATRLSVFSVTMLMIVLLGFSSALYLVQRWALIRQAHEQMATSLKSLVASIEVEPDGVEWNPLEHQLSGGDDRLSWQVLDHEGNVIDRSRYFPGLTGDFSEELTTVDVRDTTSTSTWWVVSEEVVIPADARPVDERAASDGPDDDEIPEYPSLTVVVASPTSMITAELNRLAIVLSLLSIAVIVLALLFVRTVVRRALRPMTSMVAAAGRITAGSETRLPLPATHDEVAELGETFNRLLDRLGSAYERERRFTAEASHQLRTPVTALLGQIDVALRRDRSAADYRQTLAAARDQTDRLRRIVESLLALARSDSMPSREPVEAVDLAEWLAGHLKLWSDRSGGTELRLTVEQPAQVAVDVELLGPLLDVLIENALKYAPQASPVDVRLSHEEGRPAIDVVDRGPGIPASEAEDIFRPFHRGDAPIRLGIPGLGLGLALAARIADRIGATLSFDGPSGGGCRFRVRL